MESERNFKDGEIDDNDNKHDLDKQIQQKYTKKSAI